MTDIVNTMHRSSTSHERVMFELLDPNYYQLIVTKQFSVVYLIQVAYKMKAMLSVQLFPFYGPNISRKIAFAVKVMNDVPKQHKYKHYGESILWSYFCNSNIKKKCFALLFSLLKLWLCLTRCGLKDEMWGLESEGCCETYNIQ